MRNLRADPACGWVRLVLGPRGYWRGWLGLARLLVACGFPLAWVGWLLSDDGPAVAGARRLYYRPSAGRHAP